MATNSENTPGRRVEDRLPDAKIDWSKPEAPAVPLSSNAGAARQGGNTILDGLPKYEWWLIDRDDHGAEYVKVADVEKRLSELASIPPSTAPAPLTDSPSYWNSQRKMIERAIVGLRDGWATRRDADDALAALGSSWAAPAPQQSESIDTTLATWPERIYLQWNPEEREEYPGLDESCTWSDHAIHRTDIEYVRADLAKAAPAAPVQTAEPVAMLKRMLDNEFGKGEWPSRWEVQRCIDAAAEVAAIAKIESVAAPVQAEQAQAEPVAWMRTNGKECKTDADVKHMASLEFGYWKEIAARFTIPLYAAPVVNAAPADVEKEMYTCKGKGGSYELLGEAKGAGTCKPGRAMVYRDTIENTLYFRSLDDFAERMERIDRAASQAKNGGE